MFGTKYIDVIYPMDTRSQNEIENNVQANLKVSKQISFSGWTFSHCSQDHMQILLVPFVHIEIICIVCNRQFQLLVYACRG
jgi:hypothetical protein